MLLPENLAVWYMPARVVRAFFVSKVQSSSAMQSTVADD